MFRAHCADPRAARDDFLKLIECGGGIVLRGTVGDVARPVDVPLGGRDRAAHGESSSRTINPSSGASNSERRHTTVPARPGRVDTSIRPNRGSSGATIVAAWDSKFSATSNLSPGAERK